MRRSTLAATTFPGRLEVDAFLFAVAARPADIVRPVVHTYQFNQVAAGLVTELASVQGALFGSYMVVFHSFSHNFFGSLYKADFSLSE